MKPLLAAAAEVQHFLRGAGERFCFIGGIALQRWGEPRFTRDVDLTLLCPYGAEARPVDRLLGAFAPRISDARDFALRNRVLLLSSQSGIPMDVALGALPYEERCVSRASEFDFGEGALVTCSAEDLVVLKAFAGRGQDWVDIESILIRRGPSLDWTLIFAELEPLAAVRNVPRLLDRLRQLRNSTSRQD